MWNSVSSFSTWKVECLKTHWNWNSQRFQKFWLWSLLHYLILKLVVNQFNS
jgi:hypothetical protein